MSFLVCGLVEGFGKSVSKQKGIYIKHVLACLLTCKRESCASVENLDGIVRAIAWAGFGPEG